MRHLSRIWPLVLLSLSCGGDTGVVVFNSPPTAAILSPVDGSEFDENTAIVFEGRVSDDGGAAALTLQWTSDKDGILTDTALPGPDGAVEFTTANLTPGNHVIGLRALDEQGEQGVSTIQVIVIDLPEPPEIELISPSQGEESVEGTQFAFEAHTEDAQDEPSELEVVFLSNKDGFLCSAVANGNGGAECAEVPSVGTHLITAEVVDGDGNKAEATAYLKVIALADIDGDGDGWTPNQGDCNDDNDSVYPGAEEVPNKVDDDCDKIVDEGTINYDDDGDGFAEVDGDCDDTNRLTYPDAPEVEDGEDNDCDKIVDEGTRVYDDDGDGFSEVDGDCNDADKTVHPDATERCNSKDDDCDTFVDEEDASGCSRWYADTDRDTYGDPGSSKCLCAATAPYTATNSSDCYDKNASAKPGQLSWFGTQRGDGSFDYNCDKVQQQQWTAVFDCWGGLWVCGVDRDGWDGAVPACGVSKLWGTDCSGGGWGCSAKGSSRQQTCR